MKTLIFVAIGIAIACVFLAAVCCDDTVVQTTYHGVHFGVSYEARDHGNIAFLRVRGLAGEGLIIQSIGAGFSKDEARSLHFKISSSGDLLYLTSTLFPGFVFMVFDSKSGELWPLSDGKGGDEIQRINKMGNKLVAVLSETERRGFVLSSFDPVALRRQKAQ